MAKVSFPLWVLLLGVGCVANHTSDTAESAGELQGRACGDWLENSCAYDQDLTYWRCTNGRWRTDATCPLTLYSCEPQFENECLSYGGPTGDVFTRCRDGGSVPDLSCKPCPSACGYDAQSNQVVYDCQGNATICKFGCGYQGEWGVCLADPNYDPTVDCAFLGGC